MRNPILGQPVPEIIVGPAAVAEMIAYARRDPNAVNVIVAMLVGDTEPRQGASEMDHLFGARHDFVTNILAQFADDGEAAEIILDEVQADRQFGPDRKSGQGNLYWARDGDTYIQFGG